MSPDPTSGSTEPSAERHSQPRESESAPSAHPRVTIIIPAFNEERRLPRSLDRIEKWRESAGFTNEVLVVENGSTDRTTEVAEGFVLRHSGARLIHSEKGKGAAVRAGVLHSRGEFLFVCDADLSMPIEEIDRFLPPRLEGVDVAIGSREAPGAVRYGEPEYRHRLGRLFNTFVRLVALPGCQDSQCGFKMFRRQTALEVFRHLTLTGQAFDVEALVLARRIGATIVEVPIPWHYDPDSRVKPVRDGWKMALDVVRVRIRSVLGRYDQVKDDRELKTPEALRS